MYARAKFGMPSWPWRGRSASNKSLIAWYSQATINRGKVHVGNSSHNQAHYYQQRRGMMSVLRFEEMTGTWVVFSLGRRNRPHQTTTLSHRTRLDDLPEIVSDCPFCVGNEHMTPSVLLSNKSVRVVPNKFPAVQHLEEYRSSDMHHHHLHASTTTRVDHHHHHGHQPQEFQDEQPQEFQDEQSLLLNNEIPALGFHEVVIESPKHNAHIATSPSSSTMALDLLMAFRDRGRSHREQEIDILHTVYFKNHGTTAGASLVHPHSQIVSTPVVPVEAQRLQNLALDYFRRNKYSLSDRIINEEMYLFEKETTNNNNNNDLSQQDEERRKSRVVDVTKNFLAVVPYASPGPYVITILPRFDSFIDSGLDCSDFTTTTDDLLEECAIILRSCLTRLHVLLDEPCFNLVVQTAPVPNRDVESAVRASAFFRWHIRITPRLGAGAMAGFELGSGFFSNSHMPENDAAELRAVMDMTMTTPT